MTTCPTFQAKNSRGVCWQGVTAAHTRIDMDTHTEIETQIDRQTDRQTERQTDRQTPHTHKHTHTHTQKSAAPHTYIYVHIREFLTAQRFKKDLNGVCVWQGGKAAHTRADADPATETQRHRDRDRDRQTDRQTDKQTDRQTDKQTDRQTDRQTDIDR